MSASSLLRGPLAGLLAVAGLVLAACGGDDGGPEPSSTLATGSAVPTATPSDGLAAIPQELADGFALGKKDALLTLVMYEDFQCPFCLRYTTTYEALLIDEYVKTGKLRIEFRNLTILGAESVAAGRGAVCAAEQNGFWPFHNRLFSEQLKAGQLTSEKLNVGRFSSEALRAIAADSGLDATRWQTCFDAPASLQVVQDHAREATALGLRSTPSLVLNGKAVAIPTSPAAFRRLLDDAAKGP